MALTRGSRRWGVRPGLGQKTEVLFSIPGPPFSPRKALCWVAGSLQLRLPLTFLMWSRNSGEDRQSSGLENWRQLYWKRGSRSGSRSNSLWGEALESVLGICPPRPQQALRALAAHRGSRGGPEFRPETV